MAHLHATPREQGVGGWNTAPGMRERSSSNGQVNAEQDVRHAPDLAPGISYWLLNLLPADLEQRFWRSNAGRQYMLNVDRRAAWLMTAQMLFMVYITRSWHREALPTQHFFTAVHIITIHLQMVAARRPDYLAVRPAFVAALRVTHFFEAAAHILTTRRCTLHGPCLPHYLALTLPPPGHPTPPWNFVRALLPFTASSLAFFHGSTLLTRFTLHLPLQLLYLALIFFLASVGAAHNLSLPHLLPYATSACHTLDIGSRSIIAQGAGAYAFPPLPLCDSPMAPWLVVLFTQVSVGALLPISVCYTLERHAKHRFLRGERIRCPDVGVGGWLGTLSMLPWLMLLVAMPLMATWELLVMSHARLARLPLTFDWDGADCWWYDQLVGRPTRAQCVAVEMYQEVVAPGGAPAGG